MKPSQIDSIFSETFKCSWICRCCDSFNYVADQTNDKSALSFCICCGHVTRIENKIVWH